MESDPDELKNYANDINKTEIILDLAKKLGEYAREHQDPFLQGTKMANDLTNLL